MNEIYDETKPYAGFLNTLEKIRLEKEEFEKCHELNIQFSGEEYEINPIEIEKISAKRGEILQIPLVFDLRFSSEKFIHFEGSSAYSTKLEVKAAYFEILFNTNISFRNIEIKLLENDGFPSNFLRSD